MLTRPILNFTKKEPMYKTLFPVILLFLWSCSDNNESPITPAKEAVLTTEFESGSIGDVVQINDYQWELSLKDDNGNSSFPDKWRNWWYVKIDKVKSDRPTVITVKNRGWPYLYLPVFSYNQRDWFHFQEEELTLNGDNILIQSQFKHNNVWIARHFPYTLTDLESYIETITGNPHVEISTPGYSGENRPIYLLKITDFSTPVTEKKRIMIHARTHPAETPSSFLIEGVVNFLLEGSAEAQELLEKLEFHIFPMQNADGVVAGNYRTTTSGENLEVMWNYNPDSPLSLIETTPPEIRTIHEHARTLMSDGGPKVSVALNLHAANGPAELRNFFFPHFGTEEQGYSPQEASLWKKQLLFISEVTAQRPDMFEPLPVEGGRSFAENTYPESWWWVNFQDDVMAVTMEMTYGKSGINHRWSRPEDFRTLGRSLALAIGAYDENSPTVPRWIHRNSLPFTEAELKE